MSNLENIQPALEKPVTSSLDSNNFDVVASLKQLLQTNKSDAPTQPALTGDVFDFDTQSLYQSPQTRSGSELADRFKDNLTLTHLDGGKPDKTNEIANEKANDKAVDKSPVAAEHARLEDWADKNLKPNEADYFKADLSRFESRAKDNNVSEDQVLATYKQIDRLNSATGDSPLNSEERNKIALQIMNGAAYPTEISQGRFKTCNVTTVETRTYTRTPEQAARLVTDIALTGKYTAADGITVRLDPKEAVAGKPSLTPDGERSAASQIFQVAAVNLHYRSGLADGQKAAIEYRQGPVTKESETGEVLWNNETNAEVTTVNKNNKVEAVYSPNLIDEDVADIANKISGKRESDVLLQAGPTHSGSVTWIKDDGDLDDTLGRLKAEKKFPVIVSVDTTAEPFYSEQGGTGAKTGPHVVTITDYNAETREVCVDNQWSHVDDHGKLNPITSHDLYIAMQSPADQAEMRKNEAYVDRRDGAYNPAEDAESIRQRMQLDTDEGKISNADAEKEIMRVQDDMQKHQKKEGVYAAEDGAADRELNLAIALLPEDSRTRLNDNAYKLGLISEEERDIRNTILISDPDAPIVVLSTADKSDNANKVWSTMEGKTLITQPR